MPDTNVMITINEDGDELGCGEAELNEAGLSCEELQSRYSGVCCVTQEPTTPLPTSPPSLEPSGMPLMPSPRPSDTPTDPVVPSPEPSRGPSSQNSFVPANKPSEPPSESTEDPTEPRSSGSKRVVGQWVVVLAAWAWFL